jgi:hypothetical protein
MNPKILAFSSLFSLLAIAVAASVIAADKDPQPFERADYVEKYIDVSQAPIEYLFPNNSSQPDSSFIAPDKIIANELAPGLSIKKITRSSYQNFLADKKKNGGNVLENLQIHPSRQVYIVEIDAPNGVDLPDRKNPEKPTKVRKTKKAKITIMYDAETGEQWDLEIAEQS